MTRKICSYLTLFSSGRMGNTKSRACGMNYPLQVHTLRGFFLEKAKNWVAPLSAAGSSSSKVLTSVLNVPFLSSSSRVQKFLMWEMLFTSRNVRLQFSVPSVLFSSPE